MGTEYDTQQPLPTAARLRAAADNWPDFAANALGDLRPAQRNVIPQNPDTPSRLQMETSLPWNGPSGDIHIRTVNSPTGGGERVQTNVGWSVFHGSTGGFATGHSADGADELALNILNQFVPPGSDGFAPTRYQSPHWSPNTPSESSRTSQVLEPAFRQEFIYRMDYNGGTISGQAIRQWIDEHQHLVTKPRGE